MGALTPEQFACLYSGLPLQEIATASLRRISARISLLATRELLRLDRLAVVCPPLQDRRTLYRLTRLGRYEASNNSSQRIRHVLVTIEKHASEPDSWADEDDIWQEAFRTYSQRKAVRHRLRQMIQKGWIEEGLYPFFSGIAVVTLTPKGLEVLNRERQRRGREIIQPTRPPRLDQAVHHLLTLEAAIRVLRMTRSRLIRFWGDEDLRSHARKGRALKAQIQDEKLPDGRLFYQLKSGRNMTADIELLTSKYTDQVIKKKYKELSERTLFFALTERLAKRTERIVGRRPYVL